MEARNLLALEEVEDGSAEVAMSLPKKALESVKRSPTVCIPSPESPAKRTTAESISSKESAGWVIGKIR